MLLFFFFNLILTKGMARKFGPCAVSVSVGPLQPSHSSWAHASVVVIRLFNNDLLSCLILEDTYRRESTTEQYLLTWLSSLVCTLIKDQCSIIINNWIRCHCSHVLQCEQFSLYVWCKSPVCANCCKRSRSIFFQLLLLSHILINMTGWREGANANKNVCKLAVYCTIQACCSCLNRRKS